MKRLLPTLFALAKRARDLKTEDLAGRDSPILPEEKK